LQHSCKSHLIENVLVKKEGFSIKASNRLCHGHMQTNQTNKQLFLMSSHFHQELSKIPRLWWDVLVNERYSHEKQNKLKQNFPKKS